MTQTERKTSYSTVDGLEGELPPTEVHGKLSGSSSGSALSGELGTQRQIGPYRILEVLGQGGMGTVYLAQQEEPLRRQVALKIIRAHVASEEHRLRFAAEQEALARMSHPFVAQVFDSGTTEHGEPYFVMERVEGEGIVRYCNANRLTVRQRLELFVAVCEGVEHAHQKGIIHRDLKPSNILIGEVEGRPVPKIIDFGVSKAVDQPSGSDLTQTGRGMLGTPGYWSPESVAAGRDHDTRTDVYSLGLTLFELVVGVLPFPPGDQSLMTVLKRITEQDPPSLVERLGSLSEVRRAKSAQRRRTTPGQLRRELQGDLTWIVARAVERRKDKRYPSATALSADLRRHLEDRPIEAGPLRNLERFTKLVRRHRRVAMASMLILLSLIGGFTARTLEARRANREAARANREAQRANEEAARASREAVGAERVSRFLIELFEINDPEHGRGDQITAREMLDRGAEKLRGELEQEPLTRADLMHTVGSVYIALGLPGQAEAYLVESLGIRRQHLTEGDPKTVGTQQRLVQSLIEQARFDEAEVAARKLVELMEQRLGPHDPALAEPLNQLAIVLHNQGNLDESAALQVRSIELMESAGTTEVDAYHVALNHLGSLYLDMGRKEDAIRTLDRCLKVRERVLGLESDSVAQTLNNLGLAMLQLERFEEASAHLERSLNIREKALGPEHPNLVWGLRLLGQARTVNGEHEQAENMLQRCLVIQEGSLGRRHPFTAMTLEALGNLRSAQERYGEAEVLLRESLSIADEKLGSEHPSRGYYLHSLGNILRDSGQAEKAHARYLESIEVMSAKMGADHPAVRAVEKDLAQL